MIENFQLASIPPEAEALREQVREFLREALGHTPAHRRARSWAGFDADFSGALAERGFVGMTLPSEYGGSGRDAFSRFVVSEELLIAGAPVAAHWIAERQSGPLILKYGTAAQREFYLPRICSAKAFFCIGMSEPNSGSDLASVRTRAEKTQNGWLLNGQKIWTTHAPGSHYMIALVRTSGTASDRQQGLSQFIIDLKLPGITVRPIHDLSGDAHFSEVFFDNVELPDESLIGEEGQGWLQVTAELAFERSGPERIYSSIVALEPWLAWLRAQPSPSSTLVTQTGAIAAQLAVLRSLSIAVTARLASGHSPVVEAALVKDMGTTFEQALPAALSDSVHTYPSELIPLEMQRTLAYVNQVSPAFSLRGGAREILRGMIARGLGLR